MVVLTVGKFDVPLSFKINDELKDLLNKVWKIKAAKALADTADKPSDLEDKSKICRDALNVGLEKFLREES